MQFNVPVLALQIAIDLQGNLTYILNTIVTSTFALLCQKQS